MLVNILYNHLYGNEYMEEQKGGKRNCLGTKDQLPLNKTILEDCKRKHMTVTPTHGY